MWSKLSPTCGQVHAQSQRSATAPTIVVMPVIEVSDEGLTVRLSAVEKVCALHGNVRVARGQVLRAFSVEDPWEVMRGFRMPGLGFPGIVVLGSCRWTGTGGSGRDFVAVWAHGPGVVVDLVDHEFERLLLSADRPSEVTAAFD